MVRIAGRTFGLMSGIVSGLMGSCRRDSSDGAVGVWFVHSNKVRKDVIRWNSGIQSALIFTIKVSDASSSHRNPFPSWDLSSCCSNLRRALSPEHVDKSA
jgi:hypothetical protein